MVNCHMWIIVVSKELGDLAGQVTWHAQCKQYKHWLMEL